MGAQPLSGWDGLDMMGTEFDVPVPGIPGIGNFSFFWWYRNRYRKKLVPEKSIGTGIGKIWYRKKSRNRYRKNLVLEKVSELESILFDREKIYYPSRNFFCSCLC